MNEPLVSVIVPTFNRAYCLGRTIDSALKQTHRNVEVVVVDDGSTDNTREMVKQAYASDSRVRYHYQENGGVVAARNAGFGLAQGSWVALLDSDDIWFPWKLELQLTCLRDREDVGMVWTEMEGLDPDGKLINKAYLRVLYSSWRRNKPEDLFGQGMKLSEIAKTAPGHLAGQIATGQISGDAKFYVGNIFSQMILGNLVHTSTVLLRRQWLDKIKGFNPEIKTSGEDYDFHLRTCREGFVGFIDLATIQYQTGRPDQLTAPAYWLPMAVNCLKTIEPIINSGKGVNLAPKVIANRLAQVHEWVAGAMLKSGNRAGARQHAMRSLRHDLRRRSAWKLLATCYLPTKLSPFLRNVYRRLKRVRTAS